MGARFAIIAAKFLHVHKGLSHERVQFWSTAAATLISSRTPLL